MKALSNTTELDDIFMARLEALCKSLKTESTKAVHEALSYQGYDAERIRLTLMAMGQTKIEVRMRLAELIQSAKDVRAELEGD